MPLPYARPIPPQVRAILGDDELIELDMVGGCVARLRPARPDRAVLVLHARPPDQRSLAHEIERLFWLAGRVGASEVLATGRAEEGDEVAVIRLPVGAVPATDPGHGVEPARVASMLGGTIRDVHRLDRRDAPCAPSVETLRGEAAHRVSHGLVSTRRDGPYATQSPERLLAALDGIIDELGSAPSVVTHGSPDLVNLWIAPDLTPVLTGWCRAGTGDPHRDLAVASRSLTDVFGPAAVTPFLDAYGLDEIDLRRLDAHQLLDHLLSMG